MIFVSLLMVLIVCSTVCRVVWTKDLRIPLSLTVVDCPCSIRAAGLVLDGEVLANDRAAGTVSYRIQLMIECMHVR